MYDVREDATQYDPHFIEQKTQTQGETCPEINSQLATKQRLGQNLPNT